MPGDPVAGPSADERPSKRAKPSDEQAAEPQPPAQLRPPVATHTQILPAVFKTKSIPKWTNGGGGWGGGGASVATVAALTAEIEAVVLSAQTDSVVPTDPGAGLPLCCNPLSKSHRRPRCAESAVQQDDGAAALSRCRSCATRPSHPFSRSAAPNGVRVLDLRGPTAQLAPAPTPLLQQLLPLPPAAAAAAAAQRCCSALLSSSSAAAAGWPGFERSNALSQLGWSNHFQ